MLFAEIKNKFSTLKLKMLVHFMLGRYYFSSHSYNLNNSFHSEHPCKRKLHVVFIPATVRC